MMNGSKWLVLGLLVLALTACQVMAQDNPAPTGRPDRVRPGPGVDGPRRGMGMNLDTMTEVLKLNDEQKAKVKEKLDAMTTAMDEWRKANQEKLDEARKAMQAARESKDEAAMTKAREQMTALMEESGKVRAKGEQEVLAVLTPEQKLQWAEHELTTQVTRFRLRGIDLTEEQTAKVKELAKDPAKEIVALKEDIQKKKAEIQQKFFETVREKVLTDEQKAKLEAAASRPARERPGRPAGDVNRGTRE